MKEDQPETCEHLLVLQEGSPPKKSVFLHAKVGLWTLGAPIWIYVPPTTVQKLR